MTSIMPQLSGIDKRKLGNTWSEHWNSMIIFSNEIPIEIEEFGVQFGQKPCPTGDVRKSLRTHTTTKKRRERNFSLKFQKEIRDEENRKKNHLGTSLPIFQPFSSDFFFNFRRNLKAKKKRKVKRNNRPSSGSTKRCGLVRIVFFFSFP